MVALVFRPPFPPPATEHDQAGSNDRRYSQLVIKPIWMLVRLYRNKDKCTGRSSSTVFNTHPAEEQARAEKHPKDHEDVKVFIGTVIGSKEAHTQSQHQTTGSKANQGMLIHSVVFLHVEKPTKQSEFEQSEKSSKKQFDSISLTGI